MKEQLKIVGPLHYFSGYSHFVRGVLRAAIVAGYEVQAVETDTAFRAHRYGDGSHKFEHYIPYYEPIEPGKPDRVRLPEQQMEEITECMARKVSPDAPTLLMVIPPNLGAFSKASGPVIGYTMTESDDLVPLWRHNMRCVDLLLAPSTYCLDTFRRAVPEVPSELLPIPVDDRLWLTDEYVGEVPGRPPFLFFSAFTTTERKQWRQLMVAFAEEFGGEYEDVGLFVKPSRWPEVEQLAGHCRELGAWVYTHHEPCTDWVMASLYRACNLYVQPSSEGFGLGPVEAGLCGRASVALDKGGAADVVDEFCGYVIPSQMEHILGHAPQWYPRSHKFAVASVDDLRRTLRRAYEEEKARSKRQAAASAMAQRFTPEVIAPILRERVDQAMAIRAKTKLYSIPPPKPKWATCAGAWGDVFVCVGNMKKVMEDRGLEEIGVVYCGKDQRIVDWLTAQSWCREVVSILVPDKRALDTTFAKLSQCRAVHGQAEFLRLAQEAVKGIPDVEIRADEIAYTHLRMNEPQTPNYWHGAVLPEDAKAWAASVAPREEFILLNPLSIASNSRDQHWMWWGDAIEWLLRNTARKVVLVSEQPIEEYGDNYHPRLIDLSGKSRTAMDVLALAELSAGVISTSNNLGIYAPIANIPSVIVCAKTCGEDTIYYKWMERNPVSLLPYTAGIPAFYQAVRERLGRYLKPEVRETVQEREAVLV